MTRERKISYFAFSEKDDNASLFPTKGEVPSFLSPRRGERKRKGGGGGEGKVASFILFSNDAEEGPVISISLGRCPREKRKEGR